MVPLPPAEARALEAQVRSGDEAQVRKALAIPSGRPLDPAVKSALASLPNVQVDERRFRQLTDTTAVVPVTASGAPGGREYTVPLVLVDGSWRIGAPGSARGGELARQLRR